MLKLKYVKLNGDSKPHMSAKVELLLQLAGNSSNQAWNHRVTSYLRVFPPLQSVPLVLGLPGLCSIEHFVAVVFKAKVFVSGDHP